MRIVVALLALALALASAAALVPARASPAGASGPVEAQAPPARYSLKAMDATFATPFSRKLAFGSPIPFDKTYAELDEVHKRWLRSQYENMAETDEPPFPRFGLAPLYRAVADVQRQVSVRGDLSIIVDVDSSGQATRAAVYETPDPGIANRVAALLLRHPYKPAVCGGQPCAMQFAFRVQLRVD